MFRIILCMGFTSLLYSGLIAKNIGITVATWNVQNFLVQNRFENGKFLYRYPMPESRKKHVRELILLEQPDILFLQEIGNAGFLLELQLDLKEAGLDYPWFQFSGFPGARSGLAWLSRFPPQECIFHDLSLRRGMQEMRMQVESITYRFFHVHLKSRYSEDPSDPQSEQVRRKEINDLTATLNTITSEDSETLSVLLGDFNTPFQDPLLYPLQNQWMPVPAFDLSGDPDTYFHRSGSSEVLDGFWCRRDATTPIPHARIAPSSNKYPSDHRFVVLSLP